MTGASGRGTLAAVLPALIVFVVLVCSVLLIVVVLFPEYDTIRIANRTAGPITDVRLIASAGSPDEHEIGRFPSIAPGESVTVDDTGTGAFSVAYTDARGRWIGRRAVDFDDDAIRHPDAIVIDIGDGRVGWVEARPDR